MRALRPHLLFQLLIVTLSLSIFSLYSIKQKQNKNCGFHNFCSRVFKLLINKKLKTQIFQILIIHKPSLGSREVPHKIWARSVQPFWRLFDTNKQTNKIDRQVKFIYRLIFCLTYRFVSYAYAGSSFGTVVSLPISGKGWRSFFF